MGLLLLGALIMGPSFLGLLGRLAALWNRFGTLWGNFLGVFGLFREPLGLFFFASHCLAPVAACTTSWGSDRARSLAGVRVLPAAGKGMLARVPVSTLLPPSQPGMSRQGTVISAAHDA